MPENRWDRVDIKSVGLLPNVLARQQAKEAGAQEAIFVDVDGMVKEGAATNVWIVDREGTLRTRPAESGILRGVTRTTLMDVAKPLGLAIEETAFSVEEMLAARRSSSPLLPASAFPSFPSTERRSATVIQEA